MRGIFAVLILVLFTPGCTPTEAPPDLRAMNAAALQRSEQDHKPRKPPVLPLPTSLSGAAISPDGTRVLTGHAIHLRYIHYGHGQDMTGLPGTLCVWDVETGSLVRAYDAHDTAVEAVAFLGENGRAVTGGSDGRFMEKENWRVWNLDTGRLERSFPRYFGLTFEISRDGKFLVAEGQRTHEINLYDLRSGTVIRTFDRRIKPLLAGPLSAEGLPLFGVEKLDEISRLHRLDSSDAAPLYTLLAPPLTFSPDGRIVASTRHVPIPKSKEWKIEIILFKLETGELINSFGKWQDRPELMMVQFLYDGHLMTLDSQAVTVWKAEDGQKLRRFPIEPRADTAILSANRKFVLALNRSVLRPGDPKREVSTVIRVHHVESGRVVQTWTDPWKTPRIGSDGKIDVKKAGFEKE